MTMMGKSMHCGLEKSDLCTFSYSLEREKLVYTAAGFVQSYAREVADEVCDRGCSGK